MENLHLSNEELVQVVQDGPLALFAHSDSKAHQHLMHEGCAECAAKLVALLLVAAELRASAANN